MAGTLIGGKAAAKTNKRLYGEDYYIKLGKEGGKWTGIKGFAAMSPEKRSEAGRKGGSISRRNSKNTITPEPPKKRSLIDKVLHRN